MSTLPIGAILLAFTVLQPLTSHAADTGGLRVEVSGDYRYAYHAAETAAEAKALACREALRLAVANSPVFREQTASVVDSPLLHDLAHILATRYVQDRQILEQTEHARTVSCRIRGMLALEEIARIIRTQLAGGGQISEGLDQNRALRILAAREEGTGTIAIQYQALKRLDWLGTHYQGGLRESAEIMVDFYDEQGVLISTGRYPARRTSSGDDVMNPGATGLLKVSKPPHTKTFRVWLVK